MKTCEEKKYVFEILTHYLCMYWNDMDTNEQSISENEKLKIRINKNDEKETERDNGFT